MRSLPVKTSLLNSATLLALLAAPSFAQEAGNSFQPLGRLIFSAGQEKVAIDSPQAVSALEQEDFDQLQPNSPAELLKGIPGVQTTGASSRPLGQAFNIRGIGTNDIASSEDRIKVSVDGAPKFFEAYRMGSFFGDLDLYKRVEVLRGPASATLYGSGAIGGAINFTTKEASDFLTEGQNNTLRLKGSATSNGNANALGLIWANRIGNLELLTALNKDKGGVVQDGAGKDIRGSSYDSTSGLVKAKLGFGNDADQSLTFSASRTDTKLDDTEVLQIGGSDMMMNIFGLQDVRSKDDSLSVTYNHGFAGNPLLDLTVQLAYSNTNVVKTDAKGVDGKPVTCTAGRLSILCDSEYGYETLSLKIENTSDLSSGAWSNFVTAGVQFSNQDRTATILNKSIANPSFDFHPEGKDQRIAAYVQGELTWNDRLTFIPGVRIEKSDRSAGPSVIGAKDVSDTATSLSLAMHYDFNDNFALFGSYAQTERLPTLDELYTTGSRTATGLHGASLDLKKEQAETFELGLAYQQSGLLAQDDSLQVKLTAFHNDIDDMIAAPTERGQSYNINIDRAKIWGAELELAYDAERWFASAAWSHVKSKNVKTGKQLAETPAENIALTLGAKLPEQNIVMGWRAYYFDNISTGAAIGTGQKVAGKAYDSHDVFVSWKPQSGALAGLDVNFAVENLFDADYMNNLAQDKGVGRNAKLTIGKSFSW